MVCWVKKKKKEGEKGRKKKQRKKKGSNLDLLSFLVTLNKGLISKMCNNTQDPVISCHSLSYYFGTTINNPFPENTRSFENGTLLIKYTIRTLGQINANYNH